MKKKPRKPAIPTFVRAQEDDWLYARTGLPKTWWMAAVQAAVARASSPNPADKDHSLTDPVKWLHEVADAVVGSLPKSGPPYDGNMRAGAILGFVLLLWYSRLHLAKVHDPRRPVSIRREAYRTWLDTMLAVMALAIDERADATYFPGQEFETPFHPQARDGKFV